MDRRNLTALVAGDNQTTRALIVSALTGLGVVTVRQALDGGDAFRSIAAGPPDFVVLDFEHANELVATVRAIRKSPDSPRRDLPVVVATTLATRSNIELLMREGVDRILLKPVKTAALKSCIQHFIANRRTDVVATEKVDRPDDDPDNILDLDVA